MTIELIDDLIYTAQKMPLLDGRAYRSYPNVDANTDKPFVVINPSGRSVLATDTDGQEMLVSLTYMVEIFADSPTAIDTIFENLNFLYSSKGLQNQGYNPSFNTDTETYTANAVWSGVSDRRGLVHRG